MHVRIRKLTSTTKEADLVIKVSKTTLIRDLQKMIYKKLKIDVNRQKLYYRGKQLISDHSITDYDIRLNDVIQLQIKEVLDKENTSPNKNIENDECKKLETISKFYNVGDQIDVIDNDHGAWFEAKILSIYTKKQLGKTTENDLIFKIKMDRNIETTPYEVEFDEIRPRAHHHYQQSELKKGMKVFVNYNIEEPETRGYWYDFEVTKVSKKKLLGTLLVGKTQTPLKDCSIQFVNEIMRIEKPGDNSNLKPNNIPMRKLPLYCTACNDLASKNCRDCGCSICSKKESEGTLILCDECDNAYHLHCLQPALTDVPADPEWYCPDCKTDDSEIVKAGEKLKISKKKQKMPSSRGKNQHWGKGMACVGRTSECTIVPKDHYGPIPGVEVGTCWKFRMQVSEAGIHRPHVAGIHGSEKDGAYSLVLSGGYEDDIDYGEEFYYTGSGGRDLSGNKRVNGQSCDQKLTRMNKALALNCNTKFNNEIGGEAEDWKSGKPVRVVRNYKLGKHSKYAPADGNRYDGIYKVVKYFPEKGKSGFIIWRYLLKRDDPVPAPWTPGGKEFDIIYPPGHLEAEEIKHDLKKSKKRKNQQSPIKQFINLNKKPKIEAYKLSPNIEKFINFDIDNEKLWSYCKEFLSEGQLKFLNKVEEIFLCVCCQEVVFEPITLICKHNICKNCLKRSFSAQIYVCPWCRFELGKTFQMQINNNLHEALKLLFPGYESGRKGGS